MADMIDPAADFLWESVSSTVTAAGVEEKQPRTDEEWAEVRRHALILAESANLLLMEAVTWRAKAKARGPWHARQSHRRTSGAGHRCRSRHLCGFGQALHDAGAALLKAADDRNPQGIVDAGETLDRSAKAVT